MSDLVEHGPYPTDVGDPDGRELADIRRNAALAHRAVDLLTEATAIGQRLALGRQGGPRLFPRLEVSRAVPLGWLSATTRSPTSSRAPAARAGLGGCRPHRNNSARAETAGELGR